MEKGKWLKRKVSGAEAMQSVVVLNSIFSLSLVIECSLFEVRVRDEDM